MENRERLIKIAEATARSIHDSLTKRQYNREIYPNLPPDLRYLDGFGELFSFVLKLNRDGIIDDVETDRILSLTTNPVKMPSAFAEFIAQLEGLDGL